MLGKWPIERCLGQVDEKIRVCTLRHSHVVNPAPDNKNIPVAYVVVPVVGWHALLNEFARLKRFASRGAGV